MNEKNATFEQNMQRLEQIVRSLERGDAPLEESLKLFEEGTALVRSCGKLLDEAEKLSINYFDSTQRGHILSHFTNDIELIRETLGATFIQLLSGALTLIGAVIVMYNISPSLTLITGFTLPIVVLLSRFIISNTRNALWNNDRGQ